MQTHILHILYTRELSAAHDPTVGVETVASSYCDDFSKNKVAKLGGGFKRLFYIMYDIFMKSFFFQMSCLACFSQPYFWCVYRP